MNSDDVQFGVVILNGTIQQDLLFSVAAEKMGYDSVWIYDHNYLPEPWNARCPEAMTLLTAIAMNTKTLKLGTCVIDAGRRNPATLAQVVSTLDIISKGRVLLGIGAGGNYSSYGRTESRRYTRLRENIEVMKGLWKEPIFDYQGKIYTYPGMRLTMKPIQKPNPPILVGAHGPRSLKMIGQIGDGWLPNKVTPQTFEEGWGKIIESANASGREIEQLLPTHLAFTSMAEDYNTAKETLTPIANQLMINASRPPLHFHQKMGYSKQWIKPEDVPPEVLDRALIFGTQDQCISRMEKFIEAGVKHFALCVVSKSTPWRSAEDAIEEIKLYYDKVVSYFKT
jgi:alkanesulfonate monooxygenase SsuD/methylene tetrahydromethanopterin reductase-like flavin-dependent oxidoreductase (luciferase family)